ncbi:hypothetical protein FIBSPDRAFT_891109 [Athelia psychrophila]|uniref:Uncharacterized protein n=1 Tax=Athelia psychrophila TaxID=1759441 RepID=A0A166K0I7_9AGAM|nr:hypothetical protein FIBSPDRAFT_891109 [Fibularhizoctonia sp. CBS 109695]
MILLYSSGYGAPSSSSSAEQAFVRLRADLNAEKRVSNPMEKDLSGNEDVHPPQHSNSCSVNKRLIVLNTCKDRQGESRGCSGNGKLFKPMTGADDVAQLTERIERESPQRRTEKEKSSRLRDTIATD